MVGIADYIGASVVQKLVKFVRNFVVVAVAAAGVKVIAVADFGYFRSILDMLRSIFGVLFQSRLYQKEIRIFRIDLR